MSKLALWAGGLSVIAAGLLSTAGVPLFDGIGFPDQPYKLLPAAQAASLTVGVGTLTHTNAEALFSTSEQGPQFSAYLPAGAFKFPDGVAQATFSATPLAPQDQPAGATIAGLTYNVQVDPAAKFSAGSGSASSAVALRMPQGVAFVVAPVIEYRKPGGVWKDRPTLLTGSDIYKTSFAGTGEYALAIPKYQPQSARGASANLLKLGAGIFALVTAIILLVRAQVRRSR